jgi:PAS domain S-box-containing protein
MLDVPVWLEGKVVGVLCHEHIGPRREWQIEEIDFASSLATMVSLSIEAAQRARSELALRESEQKYRALFEASSHGVMLHDEERFLEVNPAAVRILRYDCAEQIIGKSPAQTSAPVQPCGESSLVLARKHIEECIRNGTTRFEWLASTPRGETVPLDVILTSIRVAGRQIIQAVIDDISERKRAEQALQQRHQEVVTLLDSLPGYAFFKDAQGRYVMANQNFCRAVGATSDAIVGKNDFDLFPRELAEKYRADDAALLASGRPLLVGEEEMREPGRSFYVQTTKVPVKNEQGKVVGLIGLALDITDRKKAEEELLRTLAREKELGELKSNFVSMVSHEFRTPLGIVMSSAEILRDYLEQLAPDERQHHLLSITRSVRRMAELMEEVLVLGRLDAGKMAYNPAPLDLQVLSRRITDEVYSATEKRCPISLILDKAPTEVHADERLLRHILNNLLSNAVKYSEAGTPVDLIVARHRCEAVFTVKDRGIGIPEEDKQWLFNAFQRGRNVGQRTGTGLGLVIVKRCVELHRGSIDIQSKCGEGTCVTVRLPICPPDE